MRWVRRTAVVIALAVTALLVRELRLRCFALHASAQRYEDRYYLPDAQWLPVLSLGFRQALADLIWCRSLVYFGEEIQHKGQVRYVFEYTDAVLALDPDFRSPYTWVATAAIYRPVDVSIENGLRAAQYLKRAVERWPSDGELHWDYASLLRFELAPLETNPEKKRKLLEQAAPHMEIAALKGAGPPWLGINSVDLMNKLGRTEQAIRHLEELHATVRDEQVRREIEERLETLQARSYLEGSRAASEQFERARQSSYPYISPGLFMFVGEPVRATLRGSTSQLASESDTP